MDQGDGKLGDSGEVEMENIGGESLQSSESALEAGEAATEEAGSAAEEGVSALGEFLEMAEAAAAA